MTIVLERYLRLGLQIDRHVVGMVDAYYGPAELKAEVDAAPPVDPALLAADADALLAELEDGWLRDQVTGLRTYAGVLAGESISYADEVEGCYGVRPEWTDEGDFEAAHAKLEQLLPGDGTLAERYQRWQSATHVPADQVEPLLVAVIDEARAQTNQIIELPAGEDVELEMVSGVPWQGYCGYLGDFRSQIKVNTDLPRTAYELIVMAIHETYPGHHTEAACKERALVREAGLLEETIMLVPTPQSVIAEGIATLAPQLLLKGSGGGRFASIVRDFGIDLDLDHTLAVEDAWWGGRLAGVNTALLLHERGTSRAEAKSYLVQWGLTTDELADRFVRFASDPATRSYIPTYTAGRELCGAFVAGDPEKFRRLLTERIRVGDL